MILKRHTLIFCVTYCNFQIYWYNSNSIRLTNLKGGKDMIKKVAILANGGDVSGFNAVIRAIIKLQKITMWNVMDL